MLSRIPQLFGLLALALAIGIGAVVIGDGVRDRGRNDVVSVTGSAKQRIVSDYVVWTFWVSSERETTSAASAEVAKWAKTVRAFLRDGGVLASELTVQPIRTEPVEDDVGEIVGRRLTRTFELRSARVTEIAGLAESITKLLNQNIPVESDGPQYIYTKLADLRPRLIAEAAKDAARRAEVLVDATGGDLGRLRSVNVGVFQITSPNSTEVSDYGVYDTSTLNKDVTAVVNASFAVS